MSIVITILFFFFKQKTAYEMRISDWSSDVCSSDLKITLSRSRKQELTVGGGKNRSTVDVVVRKKVTLVKPGEADADATAEQAAASGDDERAEILRKPEEPRLPNLTEQQRLAEEAKRRLAEAAPRQGQEAEEPESPPGEGA